MHAISPKNFGLQRMLIALVAALLAALLMTPLASPAAASSGNHGEASGAGEEEHITLGTDYASATQPFCFEVKSSSYRIDMDGDFWAQDSTGTAGYEGPATLRYQPVVDYYIAPEGIYAGLWTNPVTGNVECDPATLGGPVTTKVWVEDPVSGDSAGITCPVDTSGEYRRVNSVVTVEWNAACTVDGNVPSHTTTHTTPTVAHEFDGVFEPATGTVAGTWVYPEPV